MLVSLDREIGLGDDGVLRLGGEQRLGRYRRIAHSWTGRPQTGAFVALAPVPATGGVLEKMVGAGKPAVLKRLAKDLSLVGRPAREDLSTLRALAPGAAWSWEGGVAGAVLLEDVEVAAAVAPAPGELRPFFHGAERLLVVHDEVFDYGVSHCTSVMAQIAIDQATGTTKGGSLRYVEELPADTLVYSVVAWGNCRALDEDGRCPLAGETIRGFVKDRVMKTHLQVGGDENLGRGIFELSWM